MLSLTGAINRAPILGALAAFICFIICFISNEIN